MICLLRPTRSPSRRPRHPQQFVVELKPGRARLVVAQVPTVGLFQAGLEGHSTWVSVDQPDDAGAEAPRLERKIFLSAPRLGAKSLRGIARMDRGQSGRRRRVGVVCQRFGHGQGRRNLHLSGRRGSVIATRRTEDAPYRPGRAGGRR